MSSISKVHIPVVSVNVGNTSNAAPTGNFTNIQNTNISGLDDSLNHNMLDQNQDQYMDMFDDSMML